MVTLFFVLVVLKQRVWVSALAGFVMAVAAGDGGVRHAGAAGAPRPAVHGVVFGLLRIAWIIVASIFLYNVAVDTGQFQVMKDSIAGAVVRPAPAGWC